MPEEVIKGVFPSLDCIVIWKSSLFFLFLSDPMRDQVDVKAKSLVEIGHFVASVNTLLRTSLFSVFAELRA